MKRKILVTLVLAAFFAIPSMAFALPGLQLDVGDGIYDDASETVFSVGDVFTLYALALPTDNDFNIENEYYISIAVIPQVNQDTSLGSILFDGVSIEVTGDMTYGTPGGGQPEGLQTHSIFPTYYTEVSFLFQDANRAKLYNSEDSPGGFSASDPGDNEFLYYTAFNVDVSGLNEDYEIHFDLYDYAYKKDELVVSSFAPFSHDAQSDGSGGGGDYPPVPEPGTVVLLGLGLVGLAGYRKYKK